MRGWEFSWESRTGLSWVQTRERCGDWVRGLSDWVCAAGRSGGQKVSKKVKAAARQQTTGGRKKEDQAAEPTVKDMEDWLM